ncbi:hypothetical protein SO802_013629 [Lithocarpus litseifolius]|uniref:Helitron helicase-like domain-containing protein n=1 Tax=Lithocarpus litseifolius TaxID=425828 RepID=A0AAW2D8S5_9ROSI
MGSLANLNEDVVHSNSTSQCVSLIPPNREATPSFRLTHIRNLVQNIPVKRNAMHETNGLPPINPTIMPNNFEAGPSHINFHVNDVSIFYNYIADVERIEEVENINDQNHGDGYREQGVDNTFDGTAHVTNCKQGRYNCAKDFKEGRETIRYQLPQPKTCRFCNARLFHRETSLMCCKDGKMSLPNIPICLEFMELICEQTPRGKHFRQYIRVYNNMFAFTSMGVRVNESVASNSRGIYTFRAQVCVQLYVYDTGLEIQRRMSQSVEAHEDIVRLIQRILDMHNPFVERFR